MKKIIATLTLLISFYFYSLADVQPGYVRTIKRPGKKVEYIQDVQISVKGVPGSFRSKGKNGRFELELKSLNLHIGQQFDLNTVRKDNYELYDYGKTMTYAPHSPLEIVMRDVLQEAKDKNIYASNMFKGSEANYKKKIKQLEKEVTDGKKSEEAYRAELQSIQDAFEKYQSTIDAVAKRYAGLDYANIDPTTEKINIAIISGDFVLADSLLNSVGDIARMVSDNINSRSDINAKKNLGNAIIREATADSIRNHRDAERLAELAYAKYQTFRSSFENDSAVHYLKLRALLVPDNAEFQIEYARFLNDVMVDFSTARDVFMQTIPMVESQSQNNHRVVALCYSGIGSTYLNQAEYANAFSNYEKAYNIRVSAFGENHSETATSLNDIGVAYQVIGDYDKAFDSFEKSLNIRLNVANVDSMDISTSYGNLGTLLTYIGDYERAFEYTKTSLAIRERMLNGNHPDLALIYNNIGANYKMTGKYTEAREYFEKSLNIYKTIYGANHPNVALLYGNIGDLQTDLGNYTEALEYLSKSKDILEKVMGKNHHYVATILNNIGGTYEMMENFPEALKCHEESLKIKVDAFGENHPDVATSLVNIGSVNFRMGNYQKNIDYNLKAIEIYMKLYKEENIDVASCYHNIGGTYTYLGDYENAEEYIERGVNLKIKLLGENHPILASSYKGRATLKYALGEYDSAMEDFKRALDIMLPLVGEDHPRVNSLREEMEILREKMNEK